MRWTRATQQKTLAALKEHKAYAEGLHKRAQRERLLAAEEQRWEARKQEARAQAEQRAKTFAIKSDLRPLPTLPQHPVGGFSLAAKPRSPHGRKDIDALLKHMGIR